MQDKRCCVLTHTHTSWVTFRPPTPDIPLDQTTDRDACNLKSSPSSDNQNYPVIVFLHKNHLAIYSLIDFVIVWTSYIETLYSRISFEHRFEIKVVKESKSSHSILDTVSHKNVITGRGLSWASTHDWPAVMSTDFFKTSLFIWCFFMQFGCPACIRLLRYTMIFLYNISLYKFCIIFLRSEQATRSIGEKKKERHCRPCWGTLCVREMN